MSILTFWYPSEYNFLAPAKYAFLRFSVLPSSSPTIGIVQSRNTLPTFGVMAAIKQTRSAVRTTGHRLAAASTKDCVLPMVKFVKYVIEISCCRGSCFSIKL
jgi:hypothetical protein